MSFKEIAESSTAMSGTAMVDGSQQSHCQFRDDNYGDSNDDDDDDAADDDDNNGHNTLVIMSSTKSDLGEYLSIIMRVMEKIMEKNASKFKLMILK